MDFYFEIALQRAEDVKSLQWLQDMARIEYPEYPGKANGWTMHSPRLTMQHVSQGRKRCGVNVRSVVWLVSDESRHLHITINLWGVYVHATWSRQLFVLPSFGVSIYELQKQFAYMAIIWKCLTNACSVFLEQGLSFRHMYLSDCVMLRASCIYGCACICSVEDYFDGWGCTVRGIVPFRNNVLDLNFIRDAGTFEDVEISYF